MSEETKERLSILAKLIYLEEENRLLKLMIRGVEIENTKSD